MRSKMYNIVLAVMAFLILSLGANGLFAQGKKNTIQVPKAFRTQLGSVFQSYLEIRDALGGDDVKSAAAGAKELKENLNAINNFQLITTQRSEWKKQAKLLTTSAQEIQESSDINTQRSAFYGLSNALTETLKAYGPIDKTLYRQHCPMAFNNQGGDWLSDSKVILNPYLGTKMPKCGVTKETFSSEE